MNAPVETGGMGHRGITEADMLRRLRKRNRVQSGLKFCGITAIGFAFLMLFVLVLSLVWTGYKAFTQTHIEIEVYLDPDVVDPVKLPRSNYRKLLLQSMTELLPDVEGRQNLKQLEGILSKGAQFMLRDRIVDEPSLIGTTLRLEVPVSDPYDQLNKGTVNRKTPEEHRRLSDMQIGWFDRLVESGYITRPLNWGLIVNPDSRFPELAGLKGALAGSFWAILVCFLISFPLGIGAAIYLEEFAPRSRISDIIEVNINNLAAVPLGRLWTAGAGCLHWLVRHAAICPHRRWTDIGTHDDADDHHRHPRGPQGSTVQYQGSRPGHRRLAPAGRFRSRPAPCHARNTHRHHNRTRPSARRNRTASHDWHERLYHLCPDQRLRQRHRTSDADLHLGRQSGKGVRQQDLCGHSRPADVSDFDERPRHFPAQQI